MRLAVIVSFLDEERFLPTFLASVARQTRSPERLVLVDDGSRDTSLSIAQGFAARTPYATLIALPRRSTTEDRLAGAPELRTFQTAVNDLEPGFDLVAKLDADLELPSRFFEEIVRAFEAEPGWSCRRISQRAWQGRHNPSGTLSCGPRAGAESVLSMGVLRARLADSAVLGLGNDRRNASEDARLACSKPRALGGRSHSPPSHRHLRRGHATRLSPRGPRGMGIWLSSARCVSRNGLADAGQAPGVGSSSSSGVGCRRPYDESRARSRDAILFPDATATADGARIQKTLVDRDLMPLGSLPFGSWAVDARRSRSTPVRTGPRRL